MAKTMNNWNNTVSSASSLTLSTSGGGTITVDNGTGAINIGNTTGTTTIQFGTGSALNSYVAKSTFTPSMNFGGSSVGLTYTLQSGYYADIGSMYIVQVSIILSNVGSSTGNVQFTGLPITSPTISSIYNFVRVKNISYASGSVLVAQCAANATTGNLQSVSNVGAGTTLTNTAFSNNSEIYFTEIFPK